MISRFIPLLIAQFFVVSLFSQNYLMDGSPINDCQGFFLDSGGSTGNYGPNENFTTTICPDMSTGTHIQLIFSGVEVAGDDNLCFFDGDDMTAPALSCAGDFDPGAPFIIQATAVNPTGCLTVSFTSSGTTEGQGWSGDINCIPACQLIESTLVSTTPAIFPSDTGWIDICPGDAVNFLAAGIYPQNGEVYQHSDLTSDFYWDFGDGTITEGVDVTKIYNEPGGYIVQLVIEDILDCTSSNFISQRIRVAPYPNFELGTVPEEICIYDTINLSAIVSSIDSTYQLSATPNTGSFQTGGVRSDSLPLPDGDGASYSTSIMFTSFSPGQTLTDINDLLGICVSMEHSWMFDLEINLTCPDGTTVQLQTQEDIFNETFLGIPYELDDAGGGFPPIQGTGMNYCWTPNSTNGTWTEYVDLFDPQTLPELDYESFEPLTNFLGCPLNGEWTITVVDKWASDNGWMFEWSINFADELFPDIEVFTPGIVDFGWIDNPSIFYYSQDSIAASPQSAGLFSYSFSVTDEFACVSDTTFFVNVLPAADPNCYSCINELDVLNDTLICPGELVVLDATLPPNFSPTASLYESFVGLGFDHISAPVGLPLETGILISSFTPNALTDATTQIDAVCIDISHPYLQDIDLFLQTPNGQLMELTSDNGGSGNNYTNTCFTPTAVVDVVSGTAPFTGDYIPEGDWTDLNGTSINGEWKLLIADDQSGFGGTINSWSISFTVDNEIVYTWTPSTDLSCADCPIPTATPVVSTTYIVEINDDFNCTRMDTVLVEVSTGFLAPDLLCNPIGNDGVNFSWSAVAGAGAYEISIDNGVTWLPPNGILEHTIMGLGINEQVTLQVRVVSVSVGCLSAVAETSCTSLGCMLEIDTVQVSHPSCAGTDDGSVLLSSSNGLFPTTYFLDGVMGGPAFNGIGTGMHQLVGVDNLGCTDTINIDMTPIGEILNLSFTIDSVSCNGNSNGQAVVAVDGGSGNFSYLWNTTPVTNTPMAMGLLPGMYTVVVTDLVGCSVTETIEIFEPAPLQAMMNFNDISCNTAADGTASAQGIGGTGPYTYNWSNNQSGDQISALDFGNYTVTIEDAKGCTTMDMVTITEPDPLVVTADSIDASCFGAFDGQLFCLVGSTVGGVSFSWSGPAGYISTQQNPVGLSSGTYCVTVQDANACIANVCTEINEPTAIVLDGNTTATLCADSEDGTATILPAGGTGNYTYLWSDNNAQNTPTAIDLISGNYTVTVTDGNFCTSTFDLVVPQSNPILFNSDSTPTTCFNASDGTASVSTSGGVGQLTFLWDANAANQNTMMASDLVSGNYCVTITDANNCTVSTCVDVASPAELVINDVAATAASCFGENDGQALATVSGGAIGNYTYLWSDPNAQFLNPATSLLAGNYWVTVTDAAGCTSVENVTIGEPDLLIASGNSTDIACFGGTDGTATAVVNGGTSPFTYLWPNGQTDAMATDLTAGPTTVTITDNNGCQTTADFTINEPVMALSLTIDQTFVGCYDAAEGEAMALGSGGTGMLSYEWSNSAGNTATANALDAIVYEVTVSDENACTVIQTIEIAQLDSIEINIASVPPTCNGLADGAMAVNFITRGGVQQDLADYAFSWNANGAMPFVENLLGNQTYIVTVEDMIGCTATIATYLDQPEKIKLELTSTDAMCFGLNDGTATVVDAPGIQYTYQWDANAMNQTTATADSLAAGIYSVTVTDGVACSADTTITVDQPMKIRIDFEKEDVPCRGDSIGTVETFVIGGIPNYQYEWSTGADSANLSDLGKGLYSLTLTDGQNCTSIDSVYINELMQLSINSIPTDPTCFGDRDGRLEIEVNGGQSPFKYSLDGDNYLGTPILIGLTAGEYDIFVKDANDCVTTTTQLLSDPPEFMVNAGMDEQIQLGDSTYLAPSFENNNGTVQFSWSAPYEGTLSCPVDTIPCFDPKVKVDNTIVYELYGVDEAGCDDTDEVTIEILKSRNIFVPTAFTPNGDNVNNFLTVHGKEGVKVNLFQVFDRWGTLVFESEDFYTNDVSIANAWDGRYRNVAVNTGVFVWLVEAEYLDGFKEVYKGNTTLIR